MATIPIKPTPRACWWKNDRNIIILFSGPGEDIPACVKNLGEAVNANNIAMTFPTLDVALPEVATKVTPKFSLSLHAHCVPWLTSTWRSHLYKVCMAVYEANITYTNEEGEFKFIAPRFSALSLISMRPTRRPSKIVSTDNHQGRLAIDIDLMHCLRTMELISCKH